MNQTKFNYKMVAFPIFLLFTVFLLWASLLQVNEFVQGVGKIVPSGNIQKVQHLEGGIISEILVKEGEKVKKGQTLYRIRNESAISDLNTLQVQLYAKSAEEARLRAELAGADNIQFSADVMEKVPNIIDNQKRLFFQRRDKFKDSIDVLEQQADQKRYALIENQNNAKNIAVQYHYAKEQEAIVSKLSREGAGSKKDLISAQIYTQQLLTQLEKAQNQTKTDQKALSEAIARIAQAKIEYQVEVQTQLSQVLVDIEKLKEKISISVDKVLRTDVVSPVDGLVKKLNFNTVGGIVAPGQVMAEIIPTDDRLIIQGRIPPKQRGRIFVGQKANIQITAYDSSIHGQIQGIITEISADTFTEPNGGSYYQVKIEASKPDFGINKPLYPGLIANINIATGKRNVITYVFKPVLKILDSALIEP